MPIGREDIGDERAHVVAGFDHQDAERHDPLLIRDGTATSREKPDA
jgi:hypothetical protein